MQKQKYKIMNENKFEQMASTQQSEHQVKEFRQLKRLKKMLEINKGDTLKCKSLNKQIKKREKQLKKGVQ